ncbi:hypothetical protein GX586_00700 [bacterium]|nr:hypothetical protein [bacterium]
MKRIPVLALAIVAACALCRAEEQKAAKAQAEPRAAESPAAEAAATEWSAKNLLYGPFEIGYGATLPLFIGGLGTYFGAAIPFQAMKPGSQALLPYTIPAGMAFGATAGALFSPVIILEGVVDTLTCGAFADRPFDWFIQRQQQPVETDDVQSIGNIMQRNLPQSD